MADKFNLIRTPRLVFGSGRISEVPSLIREYGDRVLMITGLHSFKANPEIRNLFTALEGHGFTMFHEKVGPEPSPSDIDSIVLRHGSNKINIVLALGGGSSLDAGKAISAMLPEGGLVKDYLEGVGSKKHHGKKIFLLAIPTTAGTGSEATSNAVITETGENGFKRSLRHENFVPDIALIDPLLMLDCPPDITASTGMDAFTQLVESYVSVKANPFTDALAIEGISRIRACLVKAVEDGHDTDAREGMAIAAYFSGITLSNAGLGLVHGFASAIGGYFRAPHGTVCATLMAVVNRFNIKACEDSLTRQKYAILGRILSMKNDRKEDWYLKFTPDYLEELTEKLKIKRLGAFGITTADLERIVRSTDHKSNPVKFPHDELIGMLRARL